MFETVIRKCTSCHHEDESSTINSEQVCSWCKEGTMEIIHRNKGFDMNEILERLEKN